MIVSPTTSPIALFTTPVAAQIIVQTGIVAIYCGRQWNAERLGSPLDRVTSGGHVGVVRALFGSPAVPDVGNISDVVTLDRAVIGGSIEVVEELLSARVYGYTESGRLSCKYCCIVSQLSIEAGEGRVDILQAILRTSCR